MTPWSWPWGQAIKCPRSSLFCPSQGAGSAPGTLGKATSSTTVGDEEIWYGYANTGGAAAITVNMSAVYVLTSGTEVIEVHRCGFVVATRRELVDLGLNGNDGQYSFAHHDRRRETWSSTPPTHNPSP